MAGMRWPKSKLLQVILALVADFLSACGIAFAAAWLSARYFVWKYPTDGLNGLGVLAVGMFTFILAFGIGFTPLFLLLEKMAKSDLG